MTIPELKAKMAAAEAQMSAIIADLQTDDVEVTEVRIETIDVTCRDSARRPQLLFNVKIETKIVTQ